MSVDDIRLLRLPEVLLVSGLSRSTIYRMMKKGQFPAQIQTGARAVAWRAGDIRWWLEDRPPASQER